MGNPYALLNLGEWVSMNSDSSVEIIQSIEQIKEKDAYDIYFCLKQYEDRLDELVDEFRPHLENGLIQEGLHKLAKNFETEEHTGPKFVADFEEITDEEDRAQIQRDAFERTNYLLRELGVV